MKVRYDLAANVTLAMVLQEVLANQHRYKAEPLFSRTGTGSPSSASTSDSAGSRRKCSMARRPETHAACEKEWREGVKIERTLLETLDWLRSFHRKAPFLFFNGNTFAEIARTLTDAGFPGRIPHSRRREAALTRRAFCGRCA